MYISDNRKHMQRYHYNKMNKKVRGMNYIEYDINHKCQGSK